MKSVSRAARPCGSCSADFEQKVTKGTKESGEFEQKEREGTEFLTTDSKQINE